MGQIQHQQQPLSDPVCGPAKNPKSVWEKKKVQEIPAGAQQGLEW